MTESRIEGFPPIADERSKVLVLGSMPSPRSLEKSEYYRGTGRIISGE